ncbi:hypothetical protein FOZ63_010412 [Perkinsus olseni]|nr:hypothetical protein FOZ63_010412 [Perkinsus olseni]
MSMAAPSLDHLARLDIAHLVSPSVAIKSTKSPFPDVRERATVRLLATAGRSLSHRVLDRELSLQREPYPSIAKFRYIHRTLSHMSVSRFVTKVMSIGVALKGASCRRKAVMFFAFVGWAAPCLMQGYHHHAWLLSLLQRVAEEGAGVNPTLAEELAAEFEVDLEEDSELKDVLYECLRFEGEEGRAAEGEGLRILTDGYTNLLQRLDPQESLVVAEDSDSALPTEWIDLYAEAYLKLEPLIRAGRYPCSPRGAFLRAIAAVAPSRPDIIVTRIRRVHLLHSLATLEATRRLDTRTEGTDEPTGEESSVGAPSAVALEDNPEPSASSPRSAVEEVHSAASLTRPTSVSSLLSSSSESVVDLPEDAPSLAEVSSLNYSATEHGSPRLKWRGPVEDTRLDEPAGDVERCHGGGSAEGRRPSKTRGHFRPRVLVPPVRFYPVSEEEAKCEEGLHAMPPMEAPPSGSSGDEPVESPIVRYSDEIVNTEHRSALPNATKSCDPPVEPISIVEDSTRSSRGRRRLVNGINMRFGFSSVRELEGALVAKRKSLGLDDSDAARRIEAKVAESRSKVDPCRTQFMSELRAKVAQMQQRMDALRSSPAEVSKVDPGTSCLEETVARSLVWDGMDPVEARMLARKVDKARVSRVLERLATQSSDLTGAKGPEVKQLQKLASRRRLERELRERTDTVVGSMGQAN